MTETSRIYLRVWKPSDARSLTQIASQEHIVKWMPEWTGVEEWASDWLETQVEHHRIKNPYGKPLSWAIVEKMNLKIIGQITIGTDGAIHPTTLGVSCFIEESQQNQGYASELMGPFARSAYAHYACKHVYAVVRPDNLPAAAAVKRAGYQYVETMVRDDEPMPIDYYRFDWLTQSQNLSS